VRHLTASVAAPKKPPNGVKWTGFRSASLGINALGKSLPSVLLCSSDGSKEEDTETGHLVGSAYVGSRSRTRLLRRRIARGRRFDRSREHGDRHKMLEHRFVVVRQVHQPSLDEKVGLVRKASNQSDALFQKLLIHNQHTPNKDDLYKSCTDLVAVPQICHFPFEIRCKPSLVRTMPPKTSFAFPISLSRD
jgi:hypothetical protein